MADLYDAVGHGMWAYSNAAFRVEVLGGEKPDPGPGTLVAVTHRKETDVPVICPPLYFAMGGTAEHHRPHALRRPGRHVRARVLRRVPAGPAAAGAAAALPRRRRQVAPARERLPDPQRERRPRGRGARRRARRRACRARPGGDASRRSRQRAAACGLDTPARGGDVLHGVYADLLWEPLSPEDTRGLEEFWSRRAARAAGDFRTLVEIVRDGNVLIVFPEGRPSPDGEIGPIKPGIGALVRRGKPRAIRPLALAYDPLVRGRTRVHLALGEPVEPPTEDVEGALLALLRVTMPLTCGQVVAARLRGRRGRRPARARARPGRRRRGRAGGGPSGRARPGDGCRPPPAAHRSARRGPAPGGGPAVPRPRVRERQGLCEPESSA